MTEPELTIRTGRRGRGKDSRYVRLAAGLVERADLAGVDVSAVCATAVGAVCDAVERGEPQTLTFGFKVTRSLDIQRAALEEAPRDLG